MASLKTLLEYIAVACKLSSVPCEEVALGEFGFIILHSLGESYFRNNLGRAQDGLKAGFFLKETAIRLDPQNVAVRQKEAQVRLESSSGRNEIDAVLCSRSGELDVRHIIKGVGFAVVDESIILE